MEAPVVPRVAPCRLAPQEPGWEARTAARAAAARGWWARFPADFELDPGLVVFRVLVVVGPGGARVAALPSGRTGACSGYSGWRSCPRSCGPGRSPGSSR